jgi:hypothetical protein
MSVDDLMWAKNIMHMFGGVEPSCMKKFVVSPSYDLVNNVVRNKITYELPDNTVIENQEVCSVSGAIIRRSTTGFPQTEMEGTSIAVIKASDGYSGTVNDSDVVVGTTYYYSAFPYSTNGVYNRSVNKSNRSSVKTAKYAYLFGYDLTVATTSPTGRVAYPSDVDNAAYTAAKMNTSTGVFNYGSWPSTPGEKFMPKPCMIKYTGKAADYYLDPDDYSKKEDGVTASDYANTSYAGNAMIEWPKIYTHRELVDGVYKFRCSDQKLDDDWDCWSNYDANDNEIDHFYTPIYFGSNVLSRLRSISGQGNFVSNTRQTEVSYARQNGEGWDTEFLSDRLLIQDLLVLMCKTTEIQTAIGTGRCASGNTSAIGQGTMNTKGMFWGNQNQSDGVKVFGMENWWGNLWRNLRGWINANGTQKVKLTAGVHDGSTAADYNFDGTGYLTVSGATPAGSSGGYISGMSVQSYGRIPYQASGSSSTNEGDGLWFNNSQVDYAFVGGRWNEGLLDGPFSAHLDYLSSSTIAGVGAAVSYKPLAS